MKGESAFEFCREKKICHLEEFSGEVARENAEKIRKCGTFIMRDAMDMKRRLLWHNPIAVLHLNRECLRYHA